MRTGFEPIRDGEASFHHQLRTGAWEPVSHSGDAVRAVRDHVERHLGAVEAIFVERHPDRVLLQVLHVPLKDRHLLVTCGMSTLPMEPPAVGFSPRHAELVIALPRAWPSNEGRYVGAHSWPVDLLIELGRFPHKNRTGLGACHTVGLDRRISPFDGVLARRPSSMPRVARGFLRPDGEVVELISIVPLHAGELRLARRVGTLVLIDALEKNDVRDLVDPNRPAIL